MIIINYKLFETVVYTEIPLFLLEWSGQTKIYDYKLIYSYFKRSYNKSGRLQIHKIAINETKLVLHTSRLTRIPDGIKMLTQLQYLDLSGNNLIRLPDSIGQLTQL